MSCSKNFAMEIEQIPGEDGFWKSDAGETFVSAGNELVAKGFSEEEAIDLLTELYHAAASCYGD